MEIRVSCSGDVYALVTSPMWQEGTACLKKNPSYVKKSRKITTTFLSSLRSVGKVFCTMDGHGSMVHIHPSSTVSTSRTIF
jgi:predicted heme/steroid binding protein